MINLRLNAAATLAAHRLGIRNDPYTAFNFLVEIEGLIAGGFTEVSGLQVETAVEDYQEGGQNEYVHKLPGPTRYPSNLTLKRGLTDVDSFWRWHRGVIAGSFQRKNGTIYLLDRRGLPAMWWDFKQAYPVKWSGPDLRAASNEVAVETVELAHRGLSKPGLSLALSALRGGLSAAQNLAGRYGFGQLGGRFW
ncbi:MAG TPA: phage tail protein [Thermoanaerobaculia bacterium]|nr:phage tail protein [Thermoanaerobaculia bacterium]